MLVCLFLLPLKESWEGRTRPGRDHTPTNDDDDNHNGGSGTGGDNDKHDKKKKGKNNKEAEGFGYSSIKDEKLWDIIMADDDNGMLM